MYNYVAVWKSHYIVLFQIIGFSPVCYLLLYNQGRGVTGIFFLGGKVIFFPGVKCFFQYKIPILVHPKQISSVFKVKRKKKRKRKKKKKKKVLTSFYPPSLLQFSFFLSQFSPLFPFFPNMSAKISRSEISGGALCPPPVMPLNQGYLPWLNHVET